MDDDTVRVINYVVFPAAMTDMPVDTDTADAAPVLSIVDRYTV